MARQKSWRRKEKATLAQGTGSGGVGGMISGSYKDQLWDPEAQIPEAALRRGPLGRSQNIPDTSRPAQKPAQKPAHPLSHFLFLFKSSSEHIFLLILR